MCRPPEEGELSGMIIFFAVFLTALKWAALGRLDGTGYGHGLEEKLKKKKEKSVEGAIRGASGGRVLGREVCPRKKERRYGFYSAGLCCFHTILL